MTRTEFLQIGCLFFSKQLYDESRMIEFKYTNLIIEWSVSNSAYLLSMDIVQSTEIRD